MQQGEFQGFINVKITSRIKSRSFLPRKTWKRQWVVVRRSRISRNGVELVIGRNSPNIFQVAADDVICRTESRTQNYAFGIFSHRSKQSANIYLSGISETDSQKWIATIRKLLKPPFMPVEDNEFSVAIIDNGFSRTAGLSGLYGTMRIASDHVTIIDPYTSKSKVVWSWDELSSFHVSSAMAEEDKGRICTVITTRKYSAGIGQIHLFCCDGARLTRSLQTKSVGAISRCPPMTHRHHTFSCTFATEKSSGRRLPSIPLHAQNGGKLSFIQSRRMSRSEGSLLAIFSKLDKGDGVDLDDCTNCADPSLFSPEAVSWQKNDYFSRMSPALDSNGFGLILSTPAESEGDNESLHEYQKLESDDELTALCFSMSPNDVLPPRRESRASLASGVYEEIVGISINCDFSSRDGVTEGRRDSSSPPPPLPPRRELSTNNTSSSDDWSTNRLQIPQVLNRFLSKSAEGTPFKWTPQTIPQTSSSNELISRRKSSSWSFPNESDYLPMSPSCRYLRINSKGDFSSESTEDQLYTVMKSIRGT